MSLERITLGPSFRLTKRSQTLLSIILLALILWVTRYWGSSKFGLYEDDLTFIPRAIQMSFDDLISFIVAYITHLYGHGRPFSDSFIHLFSWIGWRLGGLGTIYVLGYLIVLGNAVAFYFLVRRIHGQILAILAGVFFVLYSADTTQAYLTHSLGLFPSMLFLLLGFHTYLSRRRILSYLLIVLALLTYESTYFVFLVAPLLTATSWGKEKTSEMVRHGVIVGTLFLVVFLIRSMLGDDRIADVQGMALLLTPIRHMLVGPFMSLSSYFLRSYQVLRAVNPLQLVWVVPAFLSLMVIFRHCNISKDRHPPDTQRSLTQAGGTNAGLLAQTSRKWNELTLEQRYLLVLLAIALLMVVLAYPLTYTTRSFSISGRATRVHFAAAPGVALFWGIFLYAGLSVCRGSTVRFITVTLFALIIPLMFSFGFQIQADYRSAWERQQEFWKEILPIVAPARDGTAILVAPSVFHDVEQIDANTWNLPRVLPQLFEFPDDWMNLPMVYRLVPGWEGRILTDGGEFTLYNLTVTAPPSTYRTLNLADIVFIDRGLDGSMARLDEIDINGESYLLNDDMDPTLNRLNEALLFELLGLQAGVIQ